MSLSVFSRFSACRSSLVKLLSGKEADCKVEAILLRKQFKTVFEEFLRFFKLFGKSSETFGSVGELSENLQTQSELLGNIDSS